MKFSELPLEVQSRLSKERKELHLKNHETPWEVIMYNKEGTRYFSSHRCSIASRWAAFGGGSYWTITYGAVQFRSTRNPFGGVEYELCSGTPYRKSQNGTEIPSKVGTKKEVLEVLHKIGIFE